MKSLNRALMGVASAMTLASAAYAQPTGSDLGVIAPCNIATGTLSGIAAGEVRWVKFTIDAVNRTAGDFLDIDTNGGTFTGTDTMIGLYDNTGVRLGFNDDSGPSSYSMLSFGATTPSRAGLAPTGNATATGSTHAGGSGATLAAGTYWLAVTGFSATFGTTGWTVTTTHTRTGDVAYRIHHGRSACPTNPTGVGSWSPTTASNCGTASALARVTVTPGANPASSDIRVTADLSAVGGSSSQRLFDDGTNGDATAGDNIHSYSQVIASSTVEGARSFTYVVSDGQGRSSNGLSGNLTVTACPTGACCLPEGCQSLLQSACVAAGGVYRGDNVPCQGYALTGAAGAFEDISAVGTPAALLDDNFVVVPVGFSFPFYGTSYTDVNFASNGFLNFGVGSASLANAAIPSTGVPNNAIYALWDDLDCSGRVCSYATLGTAGTDLRFIAQWNEVPQFGQADRNTFQVVLFETGAVEIRYATITAFTGGDATIGVENASGTIGVSVPESSIGTGVGLRFAITETCVSNPTGVGSLAGAVQNCGDRNAVIRVTVAPGLFPTSTGLVVTADASAIGGSATLSLNDGGADGDATAGDNIFSASVLVSHTVSAAAYPIPFSVSDAEGRSGSGSFSASISACTALGACCLPSGCEQLSVGACAAGGGNFQGVGVPCDIPAGYVANGTAGAFEDISAVGTAITQGDDTTVNVPIGFDFTFYGVASFPAINICSNGFASFDSTSTAFTNGAIPSAAVPNNAVYPLWDDFNFGTAGACYHATLGTAGVDRRFIAQWTNVPQFGLTDSNTFQMVLFESGEIEFRYGTIAAFVDADATIGVENGDGTVATSFLASGITSGSGIRLVTTEGGPSCSSCPPCAADYNSDGGVDGGDIETFFAGWESAESCADVNLDGGIDGGDIEFFFSVWEAGGC